MSAIQNLILIIENIVGDDREAQRAIAGIKTELQTDEAELATLKAQLTALPPPFDPTGLDARVTALEAAGSGSAGNGGSTALADRVTALEARNAADDAAAAAIPPVDGDVPPVSDLTLSPATLPDAIVGQPYTASVSATGSTALPFTFSIASGALPDGLSLGAGGGISGVPSTAGSSQVSIQAHDANGDVGSVDYAMVVGEAAAPPAVLTVDPVTVSAVVGVASTVALTISGGTAPYVAEGLPPGVTFDGSSLVFDATTVAGETSVTMSDSSAPALTATVDVTIA